MTEGPAFNGTPTSHVLVHGRAYISLFPRDTRIHFTLTETRPLTQPPPQHLLMGDGPQRRCEAEPRRFTALFSRIWGKLRKPPGSSEAVTHSCCLTETRQRETERERKKEAIKQQQKIPTNYLPSLRAGLRCCHGDGLHADTMGWEREREREGWRGFWENKICDVERQILQWFIIICIVKNLSTQYIFHPFIRLFLFQPFIHLSIHPAISIFIHLSKYWSIYPSINLFFINSPIHPFSHPSIFICIHLSISIFIHPSINQTI